MGPSRRGRNRFIGLKGWHYEHGFYMVVSEGYIGSSAMKSWCRSIGFTAQGIYIYTDLQECRACVGSPSGGE